VGIEKGSSGDASGVRLKNIELSVSDSHLRYLNESAGDMHEAYIEHLTVLGDTDSVQLDVLCSANGTQIDFRGHLSRELSAAAGEPSGFSGVIEFDHLDFVPMESSTTVNPIPLNVVGIDTNTAQIIEREKMFSSTPIDLSVLRDYRFTIDVKGRRLRTSRVELQGIRASTTLRDGRLDIDIFVEKAGEGSLAASALIDSSGAIPEFHCKINLDDCTLTGSRGIASLSLDLSSQGKSQSEILGRLDGFIVIYLKDFKMEKSALSNFGQSLLRKVNPFADDSEFTRMECAAILLDITDGNVDAKNKIAVQMTETTWFGSFMANLKDESIDVRIRPRARKGIGLGSGSLAGLVHVGGTFMKPRIQLDPKDLPAKYLSYTAGVSTLGWSVLLQGIWSKMKANSDVCEDILETFEEELRQKSTNVDD